MVRCGAHLSNLVLGSSKIALGLFGTKAVQEVFESEVVLAFKQATDVEGRERQTLTSASVAWNSRELSGFGATDAGVKGVRHVPRYCP
jgi:antirestriction protein ArdC